MIAEACQASTGVDFSLTSEQQSLRDMLRSFVAKEVRPHAHDWDVTGKFPAETVAKLGELGILGAMVPEEYGGAGMDTVSYAIAVSEIAKGDGSLGLTVASHNSLCTAHILGFGSEAVKRKYLPDLASGSTLGAWGLTEAGSGSDSVGMRTKAERAGDRWVINGSKMFITQGNVGGVYVILAVTDKDKGKDGITAFVVPAGTKGLSVGRKLDKLGMRSSDTAELVFEDMEVGDDAIVGTLNSGFRDTMKNLAGGRISIAALASGIGMGAMQEAIAYARERTQFGQPIAEFQAIQWMVADMGTELEAAELLTFRAAYLKDRGRPYTQEAAMAKLFASEAAMRGTIKAVQIFGGYGYTQEYPAERFMRDAKLCEIGEGTSEVQRIIIARKLIRGY
jgi:alkylation response protein AidB-like acyl-CoA dehydrogenase